jgi:hypothetical protein
MSSPFPVPRKDSAPESLIIALDLLWRSTKPVEADATKRQRKHAVLFTALASQAAAVGEKHGFELDGAVKAKKQTEAARKQATDCRFAEVFGNMSD